MDTPRPAPAHLALDGIVTQDAIHERFNDSSEHTICKRPGSAVGAKGAQNDDCSGVVLLVHERRKHCFDQTSVWVHGRRWPHRSAGDVEEEASWCKFCNADVSGIAVYFEERDPKIRVEDQVGVVLKLRIYIGNAGIKPAVRCPRE